MYPVGLGVFFLTTWAVPFLGERSSLFFSSGAMRRFGGMCGGREMKIGKSKGKSW
jgi:hypothetical protein